MSSCGFADGNEWKRSLRLMKEKNGCEAVILPVAALPDSVYSTMADYTTPDVMSMEDVKAVAAEARKLDLQ